MSYKIKVTTTKPDGVQWFANVHPVAAEQFNDLLTQSSSGLQSTEITRPNKNTTIKIYTFVDEQSYTAFSDVIRNSPASIFKKNYNTANNIVTTVEEIV